MQNNTTPTPINQNKMEITPKFDNLEEAQIAINGQAYASAIFEYDQYLREQCKYNSDGLSEDTYIAYTHCREKLREFLTDNNLSI